MSKKFATLPHDYPSLFQGGVYVEIFSAQGKDPAAKWAQSGKVQRVKYFHYHVSDCLKDMIIILIRFLKIFLIL